MNRLWFIYVLLIYAYLYLLMFYGGPFLAFDHLNYILFLNNPYPFFFEPGYTIIAYLVNLLIQDDLRFPITFVILTLPQLLIVWYYSIKEKSNTSAMVIYACILTKSFYIGFITQRFFFAELWACALLITTGPYFRKRFWFLIPGMIHFSALSAYLAMLWLWAKISFNKKIMVAIIFISFSFIFIKYLSNFQLFGYDYSRYLELTVSSGSYSIFAFIQSSILIFICIYVVSGESRMIIVALVLLTVSIKLLFPEIEVFSRLYQFQVDIVIIAAGLTNPKRIISLFLFCLGFFFLQIFFTSTSQEVGIIHLAAIMNVLSQ